jgi:hypothetical protein
VQQLDSKLEVSTCSHCFKAVGEQPVSHAMLLELPNSSTQSFHIVNTAHVADNLNLQQQQRCRVCCVYQHTWRHKQRQRDLVLGLVFTYLHTSSEA